jgi:hypothetical protein
MGNGRMEEWDTKGNGRVEYLEEWILTTHYSSIPPFPVFPTLHHSMPPDVLSERMLT